MHDGQLPLRGRPDVLSDDLSDEDPYNPSGWSESTSSDHVAADGVDEQPAPVGMTSSPSPLDGEHTSGTDREANHDRDRGSSDGSCNSSRHSESSTASSEAVPWADRFPDLRAQISASIERLGGRVVPKLNWSCPSDAVWMNPSTTLACENAEQVGLIQWDVWGTSRFSSDMRG